MCLEIYRGAKLGNRCEERRLTVFKELEKGAFFAVLSGGGDGCV